MKHRICTTFLALLAIGLIYSSSFAQNLLVNPGFEDPAGWQTGWTIRDANGGDLTYHYHLTANGGGHADAKPRSGKNAVEIYSSDRQTYLVQKVNLEPGTYRLSAWVRANGMPDYSLVQIRLGDQKSTLPVISQKYRLIWADLKISSKGEYEASLYSPSYGMAVDDVCLEKVTDTTPKAPALYIELHPSSKDNALGIQNCLKNSLQWVDVFTSCIDPTRLKKPVMHILASDPVKVSGLNEEIIHAYRMNAAEEVKVRHQSVVRDGRKYVEYAFPLLRYVSGYTVPQGFGGLWLSNVPARDGKMIIEITDGEDVLASEIYRLVVIDPPKVVRTPKRYYVMFYAVQNWMQSLDERIKALPGQFKMMGLNVWSDYGLPPEKVTGVPTKEELVLKAAYKSGIRTFWPNFSSMLETYGGGVYSDISEKINDKDMYVVSRDGTVLKNLYNFNYAANRGRAWMESSMAAWINVLNRPARMNLPFKYTGIVNDSLEGMYQSYDPSTLEAFAAYKGVDAGQVTVDKLSGEWKKDWQLFNMGLYTKLVDLWSEESRKVNPGIKMVNTASTYGPGGFDSLTPEENMKWAKHIDYNMPQWYASGYFGDAYVNFVTEGDAAGLFGKAKGGTDLMPLLNLSMGAELEDPLTFRFQLLSYLSNSKAIKGVGYYIGTNGFTDARFMVGLSKVHTLIADIEDYYADGVRADNLVSVTKTPGDETLIQGMDLEGKQVMLKPDVTNRVRVHMLAKKGRIALITVLSYSNQGVGSKMTLNINTKMLPKGGKSLTLIDRLSGKRQPLTGKITVDTNKTRNATVYEIVTTE
jgi:hypothetical protein